MAEGTQRLRVGQQVPLDPYTWVFPDDENDYDLYRLHPSGSRLIQPFRTSKHSIHNNGPYYIHYSNRTNDRLLRQFAEPPGEDDDRIWEGLQNVYFFQRLTEMRPSGNRVIVSGQYTVGEYMKYPDARGNLDPPTREPVNSIPLIAPLRNRLQNIAYAFETGFNFWHGPMTRERKIEDPEFSLSNFDKIKNGTMTEWVRMEVGRLWRKLHEYEAIVGREQPQTTDWNGAPFAALKAEVDNFSADLGIHTDEDLIDFSDLYDNQFQSKWRIALDEGKRFRPDFSTDAYGVTETGRFTHWEQDYDLVNFRHARNYHIKRDAGGYGEGEYLALPTRPAVPTETGPYSAQKMELIEFWMQQYWDFQRLDAVEDFYNNPTIISTPRQIDHFMNGYFLYLYMNITAARHDENYADATSLAKMMANKLTAAEYLALGRDPANNPMAQKWGVQNHQWYREGFYIYDKTANTLTRDAMPVDPSDPLTGREFAGGDWRVSTNVIVTRRDWIDRPESPPNDHNAYQDPFFDFTRDVASWLEARLPAFVSAG